jgi:hypothetical protein
LNEFKQQIEVFKKSANDLLKEKSMGKSFDSNAKRLLVACKIGQIMCKHDQIPTENYDLVDACLQGHVATFNGIMKSMTSAQVTDAKSKLGHIKVKRTMNPAFTFTTRFVKCAWKRSTIFLSKDTSKISLRQLNAVKKMRAINEAARGIVDRYFYDTTCHLRPQYIQWAATVIYSDDHLNEMKEVAQKAAVSRQVNNENKKIRYLENKAIGSAVTDQAAMIQHMRRDIAIKGKRMRKTTNKDNRRRHACSEMVFDCIPVSATDSTQWGNIFDGTNDQGSWGTYYKTDADERASALKQSLMRSRR